METKTATNANEWRAVETNNEIARKMKQIALHVGQTLDGKRLATVVFGGSGMGKNHIVERELAARKIAVPFCSPSMVNSLLEEFRKRTWKKKTPLPMIFDEARLVFSSPACIDVLKDATDRAAHARRYREDYIWFDVEDYITDDGDIKERKVRRKGTSLATPIIAMTNMNLNEFPAPIRASIGALLQSRVLPIEITDDPLTSWEYVVSVALTTDLLVKDSNGRSFSLKERAKMIEWFTDNLFDLKQISIRTLINIRDTFGMTPPDMLDLDLGLLLEPVAKRSGKRGPRQQDWAELRKALS